jgi:glycosyltransferase involved in cell wall biosynthesis
VSLTIDCTRGLLRRFKGRLPTGVDRVELAYIAHYGARAQACVRLFDRLWVLPDGLSALVFQELTAPWPRRNWSLLLRIIVSLAAAPLWRPRANRTYLNLGHGGLDRAQVLSCLTRRSWRIVLMVHDLIPITHHEYCRAGERVRHERRMANALRYATGIVVNSADTRNELLQYAASIGLMPPPVRVAHLAPGLAPMTPDARPLAAPYFVVVGTLEPRKNLAFLLQLWRELSRTLGAQSPHLILIGQRGWECENVGDLLERCELFALCGTRAPPRGRSRARQLDGARTGAAIPFVRRRLWPAAGRSSAAGHSRDC